LIGSKNHGGTGGGSSHRLDGRVHSFTPLELTRFRGHRIVGEEGVHDAEESSAVPAGVPAADDPNLSVPVGPTIDELLPSALSLAAPDRIGQDAQGLVSETNHAYVVCTPDGISR
jgi:hypothetical protein